MPVETIAEWQLKLQVAAAEALRRRTAEILKRTAESMKLREEPQ